jgi:hypothetical protein
MELTEQEIADLIAKEFQKQLEMMLWSELSLYSLTKEIESKELKVEIETEYQQDCAFYKYKYWFSMPYPKNSWVGFVNITS